MEIYDISQTIREGIAVWPGDQKFSFRWTMKLSEGDSCNVSAVTMSNHTGTHVDAPYHFDVSGADIGSVALTHYMGPARVMALRVDGAITASELEKSNWEGVERVLFKTRASSLSEDQFDRHFAYLGEDAAEFLGGRGLLLVGTDAPSVDAFGSKHLRSHKILLEHEIAILEGVRLGRVAVGDYELICLPLKFGGLDGSPVRAVLRR
ncbi:MAG TPA: arylformamidase [Acidobacteriota bacterium]|nr:arylformamidase [Acidobacteriota bacterium]